MTELLANSGDPDQTPRCVASDLDLHSLTITLLRVSEKNGLMFNGSAAISCHFGLIKL